MDITCFIKANVCYHLIFIVTVYRTTGLMGAPRRYDLWTVLRAFTLTTGVSILE